MAPWVGRGGDRERELDSFFVVYQKATEQLAGKVFVNKGGE